MSPDPWWPLGALPQGGAARLVCFPFAGGGASIYRAWRRLQPDGLDVHPVQLPGREGRIREPAFRGVGPLVDRLMATIPEGIPPPFALFGHSMGALIAYEVSRRLEEMALPGPHLLVASAARPPHLMRRADPLHGLPDQAFRAALRDLEGTPEAVLEHDELMELLLPTLRADFELCETYEYRDRPPMACPILVIGGAEDRSVSPPILREWVKMTRGGFSELMLPGGHFFLDEHAAAILKRIEEKMGGAGRPRSASG